MSGAAKVAPAVGDSPRSAPAFPSENRARAALAAACRHLSGLVGPVAIAGEAVADAATATAIGGSVAVRWSRSAASGFLIRPLLWPVGPVEADPIGFVDLSADPDESTGPAGVPLRSSDWPLHRDLLVARPGVGAIVLVAGMDSLVLACSRRVQAGGMPSFQPASRVAGGDTIGCTTPSPDGMSTSGQPVLDALADNRACLVAHRGLLAIGADLDAAVVVAATVEALCCQYRRLLALGDPVIPGPAG